MLLLVPVRQVEERVGIEAVSLTSYSERSAFTNERSRSCESTIWTV